MSDTYEFSEYPAHLRNNELMCCLIQAVFDFESHVTVLYLYDGNTTHMPGAISFATRVDPKVRQIQTISGSKPDIIYTLVDGKWDARLPND